MVDLGEKTSLHLNGKTIFGDLHIPGEPVEKGRYRYQLYRHETKNEFTFSNEDIQTVENTVCFCMLNPSTADEVQDDPTIRRCRGFARLWGFKHVYIVNIFAWRATDPNQLTFWHERGLNVVGPLNDLYILRCAAQAKKVIIAWGALFPKLRELEWREEEVLKLLAPFSPMALGLTKHGSPRHPLYLKKDLIPFRYATGYEEKKQ